MSFDLDFLSKEFEQEWKYFEVGRVRVEGPEDRGVVRMGFPAWATCVYKQKV